MLFVNFLKKNAEAGQAFLKKLLLVQILQTHNVRYQFCNLQNPEGQTVFWLDKKFIVLLIYFNLKFHDSV